MEDYATLVNDPKSNPEKTCPRCGKRYPTWRLHLFIGEAEKRLAHNFCPAVGGDGRVVEVCMDCKVGRPRSYIDSQGSIRSDNQMGRSDGCDPCDQATQQCPMCKKILPVRGPTGQYRFFYPLVRATEKVCIDCLRTVPAEIPSWMKNDGPSDGGGCKWG